MIEIVGLALVLIAIGWYGRVRGGSPVIWPLVAGAGYVFSLFFFTPKFYPSSSLDSLAFNRSLFGWGWIIAVFLFLRFIVGRTRTKPERKWVCPKCMFLNSELALLCEMCKERYAEPQEAKTTDPSK